MVESLVLTQATDGPPMPSTALACLVIVGRFYGVNLTVDALIEDHRLPRAEITTDQLLMCAEAAGFRCTSLHLKWATVLELKKALPAIVRFHDGRCAVLLGIDERAGKPQVIVQNPEAMDKPPTVMDRAAFETRWDGDIVLVKRSQETVVHPRPFGFHVIGDLILGQRGLVRDLAVSTVALSILALAPILFAQMLVSYVLAYPATETFVFLCCGVMVLILFEAGFIALRGSVVTRLAVRFEVDLSEFVFERLLNLPVDFFETTPRGLISHQIDKIATMRAALTGQMVATALNVGILLLFVPVMMLYSVLLTFSFMGFLLIILAWARFMLPRVRAAAAAIEAAEAERSAFVTESLAGTRTIKTLSLDARQRHRWDVLTARVTRLRLAESDVVNRLQTFVTPIDRVMVFGVFALGVYSAFDPAHGLSLGMLFGYLLLMRRVAEPVLRLSSLVQQFDDFRSAADSLASLVNEPVEDGRSAHGVRLPLRGQIEFSNVRFEYKGALAPALQSISFDVPMGTTLGIMGRSGSGKTTITRLLQKLHTDYQGLIKIDGIDAREYDVDHLRRSLGVVLQDSFLFSGTIKDNIIAAKPDATADEMAHAARLAGAEEFIDKLPLGYDTAIEEGSPNLSDGQRQRIAIARALISNPQILIFDEATSALDAESEAIVNANLKRMANGRTMITISHRLSSLAHADAILVLDRGEVQDIGQHHELLERCDIYSGMWQRQNQQIEAPPSEKLLPRTSSLA